MNTYDKLIEEFGGAAKVAFVCQVHQHTVDKWRDIGVPVKYWKHFINELDVSTDDLYQVCLKARNAQSRKLLRTSARQLRKNSGMDR